MSCIIGASRFYFVLNSTVANILRLVHLIQLTISLGVSHIGRPADKVPSRQSSKNSSEDFDVWHPKFF